jgi:hypothetical protein
METEGSLLRSEFLSQWASLAKSVSSRFKFVWAILILFFNLHIGLQSGFFPLGFPINPCVNFFSLPHIHCAIDSYVGISCPVIESNSFYRIQSCCSLPLSNLATATTKDTVSETLCSFETSDKEQISKTKEFR